VSSSNEKQPIINNESQNVPRRATANSNIDLPLTPGNIIPVPHHLLSTILYSKLQRLINHLLSNIGSA
jgi:hypothetical protein